MPCSRLKSVAYDSFWSSLAMSHLLDPICTASDKPVPHLCWLQGARGTDHQHLAPGPVNLSDSEALMEFIHID